MAAMSTAAMVLGGAAIAAPIIGGIMGAEASREDRGKAERAANEAYAEIAKLNAPPDLAKRIIIEKLKKVGVYKPEMEAAIEAGASKMVNIQENEQAKQAKMDALGMLKERAKGGLTAQDRASFNQLRQQAGIDTQGKLEAIKQNMAARGLGGGGSELAMQLSAAQAGGAEGSAQADRLAAAASQNALQSALQYGQFGTQVSGQDFGMAQAKAEAADRFKLFDTQNSIARQQRNVGSANQGQLYNLGESQRVADTNVGLENAERYRMSDAKRQYWQDQAQLAGMKSNAKLGQSQQFQNQANATAGMYQGMGSAVGAGAAAGLNYMKPTGPKQVDPTSIGGSTVDPSKYGSYT